MSTRILFKNVRISYPHLFTARAIKGGEPKFGAAFLVPKDDPIWIRVNAAAAAAIAEKFGPNPPQNVKPLPMTDGDHPDTGHPGNWVINTNATMKPIVVDETVQPIIDQGKIYAGCQVNADITIYAYKGDLAKGVTFGLNGVQFVRDDERLDGRPTAEQMFQPVQGAPAGAAPGVVPQADPSYSWND